MRGASRILLEEMGLRVIAQWSGDGTIAELENTPKAKLNLIHCYRSMNYISRHMEEKYGIPWVEYNFFGPTMIAKSLREIASHFDDTIKANAEAVIAKYQPLVDAVIAKYRPRLLDKTVMLYRRRPAPAPRDRRLRRPGHERGRHRLRVRPRRRLPAHHALRRSDGTLIYDDVTGYEFEKFVEKVQPDLVGSGIKEKYVFQKMGVPFRQMHSWDYSGPYHGYDGFAIFARDMDMAISSARSGSLDERRAVEEGGISRIRPHTARRNTMPQTADKVIDHELLFREPEYQQLFADKKAKFEFNHSRQQKVEEIRDWTKSKDYKDKNFAREALTVNPAKACQPLGAVFVANGFHKTLSFVHGSQGCVAYYRSHFSPPLQGAHVLRELVDDRGRGRIRRPEQHGRRPGQRVQPVQARHDRGEYHVHGRGHRRRPQRLHQDEPRKRAACRPSSTCRIAHTPAFVGSHVTGYDNALLGVLQHFWDGKGRAPRRPLERKPDDSINFIAGFDGFVVGNMKEAASHIFDALRRRR